MAQLSDIVSFLDETLKISAFPEPSLNGLQVEATPLSREIKKIAFSVDAGLSVFEEAVRHQADLLLVHHGLFWKGENKTITGALAEKITLLLRYSCSLYAAHLPLDGHTNLGNAAQIAHQIGLTNCVSFPFNQGLPVGIRGEFPTPLSLNEVKERLSFLLPYHPHPHYLEFGKKEVQQIAIVTGSGSFAIPPCAENGIDLLIAGEAKQHAYHDAKEARINVFLCGHYATEIWGVKATAELLEKTFSLETVFINEPTGI